jgi:nifR3 family TIM-barrel protein
LDLNCGCSVPKILKSGAGAALLRDPQRIADILQAMRQESDSPVTVKIRSGWDRDSVNYLQVAEKAWEGGASMVSLHPRTRADRFAGKADWSHIADLKRRMPIPVAGSGDLFRPEDIRNMLMQTGCDAAMVARGAMGNPFIFTSTRRLLTDGATAAPFSPSLRLDTALRQLELAIRYKGEAVACREARKYFSAYVKGLHGAAAFRRRFTRAASFSEYQNLAEQLRESLRSA